MSEFRSGFVSIIGRPNVGKSTLLNRLTGEKVAIVTSKPQTTRNRILGVLTAQGYQVVFMDTPGIHKPKSKLGERMVRAAEDSLDDVDAVLYVVEPSARIGPGDEGILKRLKTVDTAVFLVINKTDTVPRERLLEVIESYRTRYGFAQVVPVSAVTGENVDVLMRELLGYLPEGPMYFPEDMLTDQPERQLVSELIREKLLQLMDDEIPHGTAVEIMSMKQREGRELIDIEATVYCEKDSHKGMIIGKRGAKLKTVGARARADIERLLGTPVNLQLWVKVKKDWRDSEFLIRSFGLNE